MRKYFLLSLVVLMACLAVSCTAASKTEAPKTEATPAAEAGSTLEHVATIKNIMDAFVDPSADYIWESVGTEVSAAGTIERRPRNDDEWKEERRHALILVEAANLLVMPGRRVAKAGEKSENPGIELSPEEIQALIDKDRPTFLRLAREFQVTAIEQLKAIENKDIQGMLKTGGDIDTNCENCHKVYWYPNDPVYSNEKPAETTPEKK